jgi:hypothetical protein
MNIKPVKSESDYEEALEEISLLFAAQAGTDDQERPRCLNDSGRVVRGQAPSYPATQLDCGYRKRSGEARCFS